MNPTLVQFDRYKLVQSSTGPQRSIRTNRHSSMTTIYQETSGIFHVTIETDYAAIRFYFSIFFPTEDGDQLHVYKRSISVLVRS